MKKTCKNCREIFEAINGHESICDSCRRKSIEDTKVKARERAKARRHELKKLAVPIVVCLFLFILIPLGKSITVVNPTPIQPQFLIVAQQVASNHIWEYKHFMCGDFSTELVRKLKHEGITAFKVFGYWHNNGDGTCSALNKERFDCKHNWVEVSTRQGLIPIEATTGKLIPFDVFRRDYH